jgi:deoxycytidylate deaminase
MYPIGLLKAKEVAEKSKHKRYYIGAAIFKGDRLLSSGANGNKTHPMVYRKTYTECLHAEMLAILRAKKIPNGSILYVWRKRKCGSPGLAKPCSVCYSFIQKTGISYVLYTDPSSTKGFSTFRVEYPSTKGGGNERIQA